ncbi:MAG: ion channel [Bacteroidota bacterium]
MKTFLENLYIHRFEQFIVTQFLILFGSLFFTEELFQSTFLPGLFLLNIISGIILVSQKKKLMWFLIALCVIATIVFGSSFFKAEEDGITLTRLSVYFIFYIVVTAETIRQVWIEKEVDRMVIIGLMSGYISLGFLAFFMLVSIELITPDSFAGNLLDAQAIEARVDSLMYYAYITLLTIGYGDIVPITPVAQKAVVLIGLVGQFYIVIITSVVVSKYIDASVFKNRK